MGLICKECNLGPCFSLARRCEGLGEDLEELLGPDLTDYYGETGEVVSFEEAALRQLGLQSELDKLVEAENKFPEDPEHVSRRGLPPCKRAKRSF